MNTYKIVIHDLDEIIIKADFFDACDGLVGFYNNDGEVAAFSINSILGVYKIKGDKK